MPRDPFKARGRASGTLQLARAWNHPISILNDLKGHPFFVRVQCILPVKDKILCDMLEKESTDSFLMFLESCPILHMQTRRQAIIQLKWNHLGHRSNW